ncbi:MAG: hypothetical protein NTZ72_15960 [Afipia sp.]|nr:hypothetical protein [Afipia sp.]
MMPVRDVCAFVFTLLLVSAVIGTAYFLRERQYTARDITDMSSSQRHTDR